MSVYSRRDAYPFSVLYLWVHVWGGGGSPFVWALAKDSQKYVKRILDTNRFVFHTLAQSCFSLTETLVFHVFWGLAFRFQTPPEKVFGALVLDFQDFYKQVYVSMGIILNDVYIKCWTNSWRTRIMSHVYDI